VILGWTLEEAKKVGVLQKEPNKGYHFVSEGLNIILYG
jgi:hypothetical protein